MSAAPFLRLAGPPGTPAVARAVFDRLVADGIAVGYVDLDQLGLCCPAPPDDPGNERVAARNLGVVWQAFRAAGAGCLVVSGAEPDGDPPGRLRSWQGTDDGLTAAWDGGAEDGYVQIAGRSAAEVAEQVGAVWSPRPAPSPSPPPVQAAPDAGGAPVLWITGMAASAVARQLFDRLVAPGRTGWVDLPRLGSCHPQASAARIVAGMWRTFLEAGAERLIVSGPGPDPGVLAALPGCAPAVVGLAEDRQTAGPPAGVDWLLPTAGRSVAEFAGVIRARVPGLG